MISNKTRVDALLDAIDNFRGLPEAQRDALRPVLNETLDRFNAISGYSETIHAYLAKRAVDPDLLVRADGT